MLGPHRSVMIEPVAGAFPSEVDALVQAWRSGILDTPKSRARAQPIIERARQRGDHVTQALGLAFECLHHVFGEHSVDDPLEFLDAAEQQVIAWGVPRAQWLIADARALYIVKWVPDDLPVGIALARANLSLPAAARSPIERGWTLVALLVACIEGAAYEEALQHGLALSRLAEHEDDPVLRYLGDYFLAYVFIIVGDIEGAQAPLQSATALLDRIGHRSSALVTNHMLTLALLNRFDAADACSALLERPYRLYSLPALALTDLGMGRLAVADARLPDEIAHRQINAPTAANWAWVRGRIHLALGRPLSALDIAHRYFERCKADGRSISPMNQTHLWAVVAQAHEALGDRDGALRANRQSQASCSEWVVQSMRVQLEQLQPTDEASGRGWLRALRQQLLDAAASATTASTTPTTASADDDGSAAAGSPAHEPAGAVAPPAPAAVPAEIAPPQPPQSPAAMRFLRQVTHEMRTPISGVLGMTSLLMLSSLDEQQRRYVDLAQSSAQMLLSLCNDLLDLAKLEAGRFDLCPQPFEPRKLAAELAGVFAPQLQLRAIELPVLVADEVPRVVVGDALRIRQLLMNLLGNAAKFTRRGSITLRLSCCGTAGDEPGLRFEVQDTGVGIDEAAREQLFTEFAPSQPALFDAGGHGAGLGLALCRELVQLMHGRIGADSSPGHGSLFWFELPLRAAGQDALAQR